MPTDSDKMSELPTTSPALPRLQPSSPPSAVCAYFTAVLHQLHGVPEDEAAVIASAWKLGRGSKLASFDLQTFRDLFGSEAGMLLYIYAQEDSLTATARTLALLPRRTLFGVKPGCK